MLVEQLISLMSSFIFLIVSESDGRTDESFPLETAYTVQKLGVPSEILEDNLLPLSFKEKENITQKYLDAKIFLQFSLYEKK